MDAEEEYARYREDVKVLVAVGACVRDQAARIDVRLPKAVADAAVAAWRREEAGGPEGGREESREQYVLRDRAAELALIGAAIAERGRPDGTDVVVALGVESAGAAARVVSSGGSWYQV
ncbi:MULTISPECIES: hypothetical protein [Streptomyces]|uniref:hypothetical protein n=1 Tax=Streptomyces TaxID=1883 RepID=UPI001672E702|nr:MULTISPECIES: hypothetical protein [Streptomyces]MBK3520685.1 hypothetical protein [Streptomyces sp. MBT70]GGS11697.1 hypothetical protein GCM10010236_77690 [Streptomyces eurythermus]